MSHSATTLVLSLLDACGHSKTANVLPPMVIGVLSSHIEEILRSQPDFPALASDTFSAVSLMYT